MPEQVLAMIAQAALAASRAPVDSRRAAVLLADHLACVLDAATVLGRDPFGGGDSVTDMVAGLAIRGHRLDRDDLWWPGMVHPGAVVWPVVLALGASASTGALLRAAVAGYEVHGLLGQWLGPAHRSRWHVTATAGAPAAAASTAILLDNSATAEQVGRAVALALTMSGGIGQSMRERATATAFHRAAAAGRRGPSGPGRRVGPGAPGRGTVRPPWRARPARGRRYAAHRAAGRVEFDGS